MRPYLRLPFGAAATLLGILLALNPAFAEEPAGVPAQEATSEQAPAEEAAPQQVPSEGTLPGEAAAEQAPSEEIPPVEMEAPEREAPRGLEEIVVTAEKREALLQETPMAISAFTTDSMKEMVLNNANDYTLVVPSLSYRTNPNRVFIRGVGRVDNALGLDPGVAIYTDGVYTSETTAMFSNSFGTERMEILRGPQGTLYGRNSIGGAVNLITQKPEDEYHFEGRVKIGNYDTREYGLSTTGPFLTDRVRFHLLATDEKHEGYQENVAGRDTETSDARFYRLQVEADLTESLTLWLKYNKMIWDYIPGYDARLSPYQTDREWGDLTEWPHFSYDVPNPALKDPHKVNRNDPGTITLRDTWHGDVQLTWDAGPVIAKYLYGYQTYDWKYKDTDIDATSRPEPDWRQQLYIREDKQYYSHELQLNSNTDDRLQWLAGLYYYNEEIEQPYTIYAPFSNLQNLCLSCGVGMEIFYGGAWNVSEIVPNVASEAEGRDGIIYSQLGELKSEAYAAYGELYYDLTEQLKLTLGGRYSYDTKRGWEYQWMTMDPEKWNYDYEEGLGPWYMIDPNGDPSDPDNWARYWLPTVEGGTAWLWSQQSRRLSHDWKSALGRLVMDYFPNDDMMIYGSISQGYKSGGFRLGSMFGTAPGVDASPYFDPEKLYAFELGLKGTFYDRLLLNAATYFYYYRDKQIFKPFRDMQAGITHQQVVNADKSQVFGLELETRYQATDHLTLAANYSYTHARFEDACCYLDESYTDLNGNGIPYELLTPQYGGDEKDLEGNHLPQSPQHKIFLGATYTWFTDLGDFSLTSQYSWVDKQSYSIFNTTWAPSYHRLDFFLTYTDPDERWTVIGYMKNADDEDNYSSYAMASEADARAVSGFANIPRTFGVEVLLRF